MTKEADALIIGAGVVGASLAYHLSQRGLKAVVLEKNFLASGSTGRSSGLVRMHYDLEPESRLAWESFHYFRNWSQIVGGDCGFTRTGFVRIVDAKHKEELTANVAMHQRIGIPSLLINADDVKRLAPSFQCEDFEVAAYEPESGYADPNGVTSAFLQAARDRGAELHQECRVTGIVESGGMVTGVETSKGTFSGPIVINAAGPWAVEVGRMVGLELPVDTWQHDTMFIRRPAQVGPSHPAVIDDIFSMYFRPETGALTLVGLEDGNPIGESPDGDTERAKPGFVDRAVERICKRIPAMELGSLHSAQGGYDGITPDQRAILGPAGPVGFYLVCGFSGTGFKIAPAVGACMTELILDGQAKTVDISPFGFDRFAEGKLLKGQHDYGDVWR
ncbi:MAG: FAD-dependent oxidoreductase [Anaerolineales bacterium]|nr:FAD-dependent oxidoreductase [Anaerolineales bacterium]